jgi:hypothetical protein
MEILGWIAGCFIVAMLASVYQLGPMKWFIFSFFFSPLAGIICVIGINSNYRSNKRYSDHLRKTKAANDHFKDYFTNSKR